MIMMMKWMMGGICEGEGPGERRGGLSLMF